MLQVITETERKYAQGVVSDKTTAGTFKKRAQIILALDMNVGKPESQAKIAKRVGVTHLRFSTLSGSFMRKGLRRYCSSKRRLNPTKSPRSTEKSKRG
jgi:hypothetical protein